MQQRVRLESKKTSLQTLLEDNLVRRRDQLVQVNSVLKTQDQPLSSSCDLTFYCVFSYVYFSCKYYEILLSSVVTIKYAL